LQNKVYGIYEMRGEDTSETGVFSGKLNPVLGRMSLKAASDNGNKYTLTGEAVTP